VTHPGIGTAGWTIPRQYAESFPADGSHLQRYAQRFNVVEINSSFYRPHRRATYERWAASVPENFRFAAKVPRQVTHELRLADTDAALDAFLAQVTGLGDRLGPLLVQLPPSLAFDAQTADRFFAALRSRFAGSVVCEPRHASWFTPRAEEMLTDQRIARVAADPAVVPAAAEPGGWTGLRYVRLHGAPRIYWSDYPLDQIAVHAARLKRASADGNAWCIFDNTAAGAATGNALALGGMIDGGAT
jgi:uncharacterized protein YecE (DUF72 family)